MIKGRLKFRASPSGEMRRVNTTYVLTISEAGSDGLGFGL